MLKRVAYAFVAFLFGQGVLIVSNILLVPLYLRAWSPVLYGEWLSLFSAVAYLTTLDLGMQAWAVNRLTQAYARGDLDDYRMVQHTALFFYGGMATLGTLMLLVVTRFIPLRSWFNLAITDEHSAYWVVVLLGCNFLFTFPSALFINLYRTTGDLPKSQWIQNSTRLISLALTTLVLIFWPKVAVMAGAQLAGTLLVVAVVVWDVRRRYPHIFPGLKAAHPSMLGPIFKDSTLFALIALSTALAMQGSNLLVAAMMGGAAVAVFATTRTLANSMRQLVGMMVNSSSTDLTRMEAVSDHRRLRLAFRLIVFFSIGGCLAISASLWWEGTSLLQFWTRGKLAIDTRLLRGFLAYLVLQSPWIAASAVPQLTNRHRKVAFGFLLANGGGLALAAFMLPRFGLVAIPLSFIAAEAAVCYHFVLRDSCSVATEPYGPFAARIWLGLVVAVATALSGTWLIHQLPGLRVLVRWTMSGLVSTIVVFGMGALVWLHAEDRKFLRSKLAFGLNAMGIGRAVPAQSGVSE